MTPCEVPGSCLSDVNVRRVKSSESCAQVLSSSCKLPSWIVKNTPLHMMISKMSLSFSLDSRTIQYRRANVNFTASALL